MTVEVDLVVTDLDGTLWELETSVHRRTQAALAAVMAAGIPLLIATGRRVGSTRDPLSAIRLAPPAVVLNGSLGLDLLSGDRFHRGGFSAAQATAVLDIFRTHGIDPCMYVDDDRYPVRVSSTPSTHPGHLASFGDEALRHDLTGVADTERVFAFSVLGIGEDQAQSLGIALQAVAQPHVDRDRMYAGYSVTVAPTGQSKWDGVAAFCAHHGLDAGAVMAIGDGPNDLELLGHAAISVVPEDAHPSARTQADHIVGRAAVGGWADILDILGLAGPDLRRSL